MIADQGFTETERSLSWLDDEDGGKLRAWLEWNRQSGFAPWPDHVPAPLLGYDYTTYGPLLFSRPKCSRFHRAIFRLPLPWFIKRRFFQ